VSESERFRKIFIGEVLDGAIEANRVIGLDEFIRGQQPTEIEADTADIFELHRPIDVQSLGCQELKHLLSEIDYFVPLLQDAELHRVKTADIITVKGTGVSVDVGNALSFLRESRQTILSEISRKCA